MNWTVDQITSIIGAKELDLIAMRLENERLRQQVKELTPEKVPDGERVPE